MTSLSLSLMSPMKSEWSKIEKIKKNVSQRVCTVEVSSTTSIVRGWICKCPYVRVSPIASTLCQYRYTHTMLLSRQSIFRSHWTHAASWVVISSLCLEVWDFCWLSSCVSSSWSYESSDWTSSQSERTVLHMLNQTLWWRFWMGNLRYFKSITWSTMFCTCQICTVDT